MPASSVVSETCTATPIAVPVADGSDGVTVSCSDGVAADEEPAGLLDDEPMQFSIVLGVRGGMAATADNLLTMVRRLPPECIWQVITIGAANLALTAMGMALGGNVRAGLEDTLYLRKGELSRGNQPLVDRAFKTACEQACWPA